MLSITYTVLFLGSFISYQKHDVSFHLFNNFLIFTFWSNEPSDGWSPMVYTKWSLIKSLCLVCDSGATQMQIYRWEWHGHLAVAAKHDLFICWWINDVAFDALSKEWVRAVKLKLTTEPDRHHSGEPKWRVTALKISSNWLQYNTSD